MREIPSFGNLTDEQSMKLIQGTESILGREMTEIEVQKVLDLASFTLYQAEMLEGIFAGRGVIMLDVMVSAMDPRKTPNIECELYPFATERSRDIALRQAGAYRHIVG